MPKDAHTNWDDIRFVIAVADHGSVAAAARALSVNHATVLRRIAGFESRQGIRVFDKTPRGYVVSPDRRALIETMRDASVALGQVDQMIDAERPSLQSGIRVTSTDAFCYSLLGPIVGRVADDIDGQIDIISGNAHLDFGRLQAHITVRPTLELPQDLSGEWAGKFRFGVYGGSKSADRWLGLSGPLARSVAGKWMRDKAAQTGISGNSFVTLAKVAAHGNYKVLLPVFLGDPWKGLHRLDVPDDLPATPIWAASHVDFARSGRLARARKRLAEALIEEHDALMGVA